MGVESVYVSIIDKDSYYTKKENEYLFLGAKNNLVSDFISYLKVNKQKIQRIKKNQNKYVINKILYMTIIENEGYFQGINLEGCFSCYEKVIHEFEKICNLLINHFCDIKLFLNGQYYNPEDLSRIIKKENVSREIYFSEKYNIFFSSLPGTNFYKNYNRLSFLKKIRYIIFHK